MPSKARILVTGGAGYVGRALIERLSRDPAAELHVWDNLSSGEHRVRAVDLARMTLHRVDLRDSVAVAALMRTLSPSLIFHLAAVHYIPACEAAPGDAISINVAGTVNLLHAAVNRPKFVFASTAAVYSPSEQPHLEDSGGIGPVDIYGLTKLQAERYIHYFHLLGKIDAVVVRLFNVIGPGETNPHLVPAIIRQISRGERNIKLGNLFPKRDYIHVGDAAEGFLRLAHAGGEQRAPLISNLGTGRSYGVRDVVEKIADAAAVRLEIDQDPDRVRSNDRPLLCASTQRLRALTGWLPETSMADSVRAAWGSREADGLI
ncbi:MAG: NAD-dependent epimerase/dehydratase family protein [Steroidobacteraceae bacterium]